jgi:phage/plasmid-associated DNA primase
MDKKQFDELKQVLADGNNQQSHYFYQSTKDDIKVIKASKGDEIILIWNGTTKLWESSSKDELALNIADFFHSKIKSAMTYLKENDEDGREKAAALQKKIKSYTDSTFSSKIAKFFIAESYKANKNFHTKLNGQRDYLHFMNGALNLRTGVLRERTKEDYCTKCLDYDYAQSEPKEIEYVNDIFKRICNDDDETADFIKGYHGYSLTGEVSAQSFLILYGASASNGKSTLSEIHAACLPIYSMVVNSSVFEEGYEKSHKQLIDMGAPIRYVKVEELSEKKINVPMIKELTGNSSIRVEELYKTSAEIVLHCKLTFISNKVVQFNTDAGVGRRGLLQEMKNQFRPIEEINAAKDKRGMYETDTKMVTGFQTDVRKKLAFINSLLPYAQKFYRLGKLHIPASVKKAFSDLADENDKMKQFLEAAYERTDDDHDKINKRDFEQYYNIFHKSKTSFSTMLGDLKRLKIKYVKDASHKNVKGVIYGFREKKDEDDDNKNDNKVWQEEKKPEIKEREIKIQIVQEDKQTDSLGDDIYKLLQNVRKFAEEQTKFGQEQENTLQSHKEMKLKKHTTHDASDDVDDERIIVTGIINSYKKKMNKFECDEEKMKEMRTEKERAKPNVNDDDYDEFMGESFKMFR